MRSVVLDFKNSEFIHKFLKIQVQAHFQWGENCEAM